MKIKREDMVLYAVTDRTWCKETTLAKQVEAALKGGVTCVQLREKKTEKEFFLEEAKEIQKLCKKFQVPFLINDAVDLALLCDADGVHIGQEDGAAEVIRKQIGPEKILGVSVHTVEEAKRAERAGADYLGVGAVFSTATKQDAKNVSLEMLKNICSAVQIPVVAIGGIGKENVTQLFGTQIAGIAVISAIFSKENIEEETRNLRKLMNHNYTTQMDAARRGIITGEMEKAARDENRKPEELRELIAEGKVIIPANKNHKVLKPSAIGSMLKTKINVNLGTSRDCKDLNEELKKVNYAVELGAEAIMDLSSYGDTGKFRRKLVESCPAVIGTVPIYDAVVYYHKALKSITAEEWLSIVRMHAEDGVDFMTIHCGINKETAAKFKKNKRLTNLVSRGGTIMFAWMEMTGEENPFYEYFDEVLDICAEYDVTLSLGDACRPGSVADATDSAQIEELIVLGELTKRAWEKNVQVMIEGPGHMPLNQIEANMEIQKTLCHGAPFYILGPLVTDVAPGYDHITAAIGGAVAASAGAAFLCYVTPAEHLRLPTAEDVKEGIIAAKIAAHAADIAKGVKGAADWDRKMSSARRDLDWERMFALGMDEQKARRYREEGKPEKEDTCSMCGNFCAVRNMNRILNGEIVSIYEE